MPVAGTTPQAPAVGERVPTNDASTGASTCRESQRFDAGNQSHRAVPAGADRAAKTTCHAVGAWPAQPIPTPLTAPLAGHSRHKDAGWISGAGARPPRAGVSGASPRPPRAGVSRAAGPGEFARAAEAAVRSVRLARLPRPGPSLRGRLSWGLSLSALAGVSGLLLFFSHPVMVHKAKRNPRKLVAMLLPGSRGP